MAAGHAPPYHASHFIPLISPVSDLHRLRLLRLRRRILDALMQRHDRLKFDHKPDQERCNTEPCLDFRWSHFGIRE
jgi:hypothetical protein